MATTGRAIWEFDAGWTSAGFSEPNDVLLAWDTDNDGYLADANFFSEQGWAGLDATRICGSVPAR